MTGVSDEDSVSRESTRWARLASASLLGGLVGLLAVIFVLTTVIRPGFEWLLPIAAFVIGYTAVWIGTSRLRHSASRVLLAYISAVITIAAFAIGYGLVEARNTAIGLSLLFTSPITAGLVTVLMSISITISERVAKLIVVCASLCGVASVIALVFIPQ